MPQAGSQTVSPTRGPDDLDDGLDERARREVLPGPALGVLGVLLEQALVDLALDVHVEPVPHLGVDEADEAVQLGRVLDLVLRLAEDGAEQAVLLAERRERLAVVRLEGLALARGEVGPAVALGDGRPSAADSPRARRPS